MPSPSAITQPGFALSALKLMRPKQWVKNLFVFAPVIFAKGLFDPIQITLALKAFAGFCLAASAVYIINDIADIDADRGHPEKKYRPLAAGTMSISGAGILLGLLLVCTTLIALTMPPMYASILATYVLMNIAYSIKLKEVVLLDVFIIASGFMMRVLAGAFAIGAAVSSWIVLCTLFISLFLGFAKRRGELVASQSVGTSSERKVLNLYSVGFIDQMLTIAASGTVIAYALYTVAPRTVEVFGTDQMIYTTIFVLYGVFRYLYLIHTTTSTENPTNAIISDRTTLIVAGLWITTCVFLIYFGPHHIPH
ncbi:MAG: decaprenyl-phosphate phosphoribosyltransferase [Bacteroidota bacterium]